MKNKLYFKFSFLSFRLKNRCAFFLLCINLSIVWSNAQTTLNFKPNEPKIRPNSPNASSLGEYGKIPVSYFNGTTDITIPLYEIDLDGMKIPIALNYNSSGIKVSQESSSVGLGWSLNAGGCFTRQINDGDDYIDNMKYGRVKIPYFNANDSLKSILSKEIYQITSERIRNYDDFFEIMDTEPDIYFFNFCNYQGSTFFPYNDTQIEYRGYVRNIKQYLRIGWEQGGIVVNDGYGYKFNFGTSNNSIEYTDGNSDTYNDILATTNSRRFLDGGYYQKSKTAFYLSKITACNGDAVTFDYSQDEIYTVPTTSESAIKQLNNFLNPEQAAGKVPVLNSYSSTVNNARISQSVLKKIAFKNGCIDFITSYDRKDLESTGSNRPQRITDIVIKRDSCNVPIEARHYKLYTSYLGDVASNVTCRLLLDSIIEVSRDGLKNQKYVFAYNKGNLPAKNSRQTDYWGYYNQSKGPSKWGYSNIIDMSDEGTAMPSFSFNGTPNDFSYSYYLGRNRIPNKERMQYGMLTKITYPTGGETEFVYEPHEFSNSFPVEKSEFKAINDLGLAFTTNADNSNGALILMTKDNTSNPYQVQATTYLSENMFKKNNRIFVKFSINSNADVITKTFANFNVSLITSSGLTAIYGHSIEFDSDNGRVYSFIIPQDGRLLITVNPTYNYMVQNPKYDNTPKSLWLTAKLNYIDGKDTLNYGGGLRVKEITNYNKQGIERTVVSYKKLSYINSKGTTSGHMFSIPKTVNGYTRQIVIPELIRDGGTFSNGDYCYYYDENNNLQRIPVTTTYDATDIVVYCPYIDTLKDLLFTSSPFSSCLFTSDISYSQVEETECKDNTCGKTVYNYFMDYDDMTPSFPGDKVFINGINGLQRSVKHYDSNNKLVHEVSIRYDRDSKEECVIRGLSKHQNFAWFDNAKCDYLPLIIYKRTVPTFSYNLYTLRADWWKKSREINKSYFNYGNDSVITTTLYEYDPVNYLSNKISTTSSAGKKIEERITYSYENTLMNLQSKKNFPLTRSKYVNNAFVESVNTEYWNYSLGTTSTCLPNTVQYKTADSNYKNYIEYRGYDTCGNPQETWTNNSNISTYLWSYNGQYPIFEIKNATITDIKTALGYTDAQIASLTLNTIPDVAGLRNKLDTYFKDKKVLITSFTYKPLVGIITQTDSRGVTTYYEYDTFNRLKYIKDKDGKILQSSDYHYKL